MTSGVGDASGYDLLLPGFCGQLALSSLAPAPLVPHLWLQPCLCHRCPHRAHPGPHGWGKGMAVGTSGRQAPGQISSCHSGAYRSQQLVPRGVACFPTYHPPSRGWGPTCSLQCHMGESPWEMPSGQGHSASPERDLCIRWRSHQDLRELDLGPLLFHCFKA